MTLSSFNKGRDSATNASRKSNSGKSNNADTVRSESQQKQTQKQDEHYSTPQDAQAWRAGLAPQAATGPDNPPSSAATGSGQKSPVWSGLSHAELGAQSPVVPSASGVASVMPSAAASANPRMPGVELASPAKFQIIPAVAAVPSATAGAGPAQSASEVLLIALPLPAVPPAAADPYAGQDAAPPVVMDNGGGSLEQLHQEVRGLKRRCTDLQDAIRACKRTLRQDAADKAHRMGMLVTAIENIHSDMCLTEYQTSVLTALMQQTASVMTGAAKEDVQTLAGHVHQLLMAQRNNIDKVQIWNAAVKFFAEVQQAAATRTQEWE